MKFSLEVVTGEIKLGEGKVVEGAKFSFQAEHSVGEAKGMYDLFKAAIKELPETVNDIARGAETFRAWDDKFTAEDKAKFEENKKHPSDTKKVAEELLKNSIAKVLGLSPEDIDKISIRNYRR